MENKYFLTEDQLAIQALAKDFADNTVAKTVRELDEAHAFPMEEVKMCGELGFLGVCVPEEYGGAGMDHLSDVLVMEQIARHSSSLASIIDAHTSLGSMPLLHAGTEEQKQKFLVPAASGKTLCAFALTEPQSGSDAAATKTTAILDGDEYVIFLFPANAAYTEVSEEGGRYYLAYIIGSGTDDEGEWQLVKWEGNGNICTYDIP